MTPEKTLERLAFMLMLLQTFCDAAFFQPWLSVILGQLRAAHSMDLRQPEQERHSVSLYDTTLFPQTVAIGRTRFGIASMQTASDRAHSGLM